jgi:hypothetical protein
MNTPFLKKYTKFLFFPQDNVFLIGSCHYILKTRIYYVRRRQTPIFKLGGGKRRRSALGVNPDHTSGIRLWIELYRLPPYIIINSDYF